MSVHHDLHGEVLDEPRKPVDPRGQAHHSHRLAHSRLFLVDESSRDGHCGVHERQHDDQREESADDEDVVVVFVRWKRVPT